MVTGIFFTYLLLTLLVADRVQSASASPVSIVQARVVLTGTAHVFGVLNLTETSDQSGVHFHSVEGLTPGNHGFHVHQFGDVFTHGCNSTGAHYNPNRVFHGAREGDKQSRHAGDEGNIVADDYGIAIIDFVDNLVSLIPGSKTGNNIVGRSLVVHALEDDLGLGGNDDSLTTGNSGVGLACGVIAYADDLQSMNGVGNEYDQRDQLLTSSSMASSTTTSTTTTRPTTIASRPTTTTEAPEETRPTRSTSTTPITTSSSTAFTTQYTTSPSTTITIWDLPNRDGIFPQISPIQDLRLHSSYIVDAHEVLRKGLQEFLVFKNETLETYLHHLIYHRTEPFVNEYGKTIRSYKKVLRFIWQQYNETSVQNYAIKQYDRDKLDLCSVARFLSHQPTEKNRETILKRMGEALDYQCHPCTPYRRKEHSDTIIPSYDGISSEGISPEESRNLCERYQED